MQLSFSTIALVLATLVPSATAQVTAPVGIADALESWRAQHGAPWRMSVDVGTGFSEMVYGGSAPAAFRPAADEDFITLAYQHVEQTSALHGIDSGTLVIEYVRMLPMGMAHGGVDKMIVRLAQWSAGVQVDGGKVNVLMNMQGTLLSVHSTASPFLVGVVSVPALSAEQAQQAARTSFAGEFGAVPVTVSAATLVYRQVFRGELRQALLSWRLAVGDNATDRLPLGREYWIDANDGAVLESHSTVHQFDVGGTISTNATPGEGPDSAANPPTPFPMPFARVTSSAGTVFADANGNWNFPGVTGPLNVTFEYRGLNNRVYNQSGAEYALTLSLTGTGNSVLMNPSPNELRTAQANGYHHVESVRAMIKAIVPGDTTPDFLATSNVNINSNCSAYYDGSSINYYTEGGGCPNTAYSSVVGHEYGHWLNSRYGTGNSSDGMGEGNSDVWAMYTFDTPIIGQDLFGPGTLRRTGENMRQFCGDCCPGCYGESHDDGEPWMGAAWKIRANLNTSLGGSMGDLTADTLFMGWMNSYNQTQLKSIIETQWLTLDDDDGNLDNGTPNFYDIDNAFRIQGFPGFDLPVIGFAGVTQLGDTLDQSGPYLVDATITALLAPPIASATLHYRVGGGSFQTVPMSSTGGDGFQGAIPGQSAPAEVDYYLSASDSASGSDVFPADAPAAFLRFRVGVVTTFLENEFEGGGAEGWTVGAPDDDATTGIWVRVNPLGTAAQPEDDHTSAPGVRCWVTGQGSSGGSLGEDDVDSGKTTVFSPIFDASGLTDPKISYWRWYSNQTGASADSDVFLVHISGDGGATWSLVEQVGPTGPESNGGWFRHEFAIASISAPTNSMQLRFVASDEGSGSIVEAAIDDILGVDIGPACPNPSNYCIGAPNSAGPGANMGWSGSTSIAANNLELFATSCPPGQNGLFFMGTSQIQAPFGDGFLCTTGGIKRFNPPITTDAFGQAQIALDLSAPPAAGLVLPDSTWNFQFWYRDPAAGGTGFNTSDGLEILFCN